MSDRALARVALILLGVTILLFGGIGLLLAINADATFGNTGTLLLFLALAGIGAVIVVRQPRNLIGWIFLATGVAAAPQSLSTEVSLFVYRHGGATSLVRWLAWPGEWLWILPYGALLTVVPLLFPDGRLPSSRWRPLAWFLVAYFTSLLVAFALLPGQSDMPPVANPAGLQAARPFLAPYTTLSFPIAIVLSFVCVTSLIFRYRRADGDARQQIKWFGLAMAVMASLFFAAGVSSGLGYLGLSDLFATIGFLAIPAGAAVAMLRYHLYD
ncbi:MAG TPA: hypothetical protein VEM41_12280, partial [Actinomycetota bacterium]|nr:hypothetical protein [Actinomycetota bacterium]